MRRLDGWFLLFVVCGMAFALAYVVASSNLGPPKPSGWRVPSETRWMTLSPRFRVLYPEAGEFSVVRYEAYAAYLQPDAALGEKTVVAVARRHQGERYGAVRAELLNRQAGISAAAGLCGFVLRPNPLPIACLVALIAVPLALGWALWAPPSPRRVLLVLLSLPALAFICLPLLSLLLKVEVTNFRSYVCCSDAASALHLSLVTSALSAGIIVLTGTPVAYLLTFSRFRGKRILDSIVDLPVVLPPAVAGVALLMAFGRDGLIGRILDEHHLEVSNGTTIAVVLAQVFVACPFYIRQARVGFLGVPPQLILASRTLGASRLRTLRKVILPLAWHALIAGLIMSWARAIGEFGATLIFAGNLPSVTRTMPLAIYTLISDPERLQASFALSIALVIISFIVIVATKLLLTSERRAAEASFALVTE